MFVNADVQSVNRHMNAAVIYGHLKGKYGPINQSSYFFRLIHLCEVTPHLLARAHVYNVFVLQAIS